MLSLESLRIPDIRDKPKLGWQQRLALSVSQALLLACGLVVPPEVQRPTLEDQFDISFSSVCNPQPSLSKEDRYTFLKHAKIVEQVLRESLAKDVKASIDSAELKIISDAANGLVLPYATPNQEYDQKFCQAFKFSRRSYDQAQGRISYTYNFPVVEFKSSDPSLVEKYGSQFSGSLDVSIDHQVDNFDVYGNPKILQYRITIIQGMRLLEPIDVDQLNDILGKWFKVPSLGLRKESIDRVVYPNSSGEGQEAIKKTIQINQEMKLTTLTIYTSGWLVLSVSFNA